MEKRILDHCDHPNGLDFFYGEVLMKASFLPEQFPFLEIGTRAGGSALTILKAIKDSVCPNRFLITVDPYGEMWYENRFDHYGEKYRREAMKFISDYCYENSLNHFHMRLTSFNFYEVWKMFNFWDGEKAMEKVFGFVYLDGDHTDRIVNREITFYRDIIVSGGLLVVDDQSEKTKYSSFIEIEPTVNSNRLYYYL